MSAAATLGRLQAKAKRTSAEDMFAFHLGVEHALLAGWVREHRFHAERMWRFDFAWPVRKLAVEIEGGVWTGGRHTRGKGYVADLEKYNTAALHGWRVLRFTTDQVKDGHALSVVRASMREAKS